METQDCLEQELENHAGDRGQSPNLVSLFVATERARIACGFRLRQPVYRRHESRHAALDDEIVGACLHHRHRGFVTDETGNNKGDVPLACNSSSASGR